MILVSLFLVPDCRAGVQLGLLTNLGLQHQASCSCNMSDRTAVQGCMTAPGCQVILLCHMKCSKAHPGDARPLLEPTACALQPCIPANVSEACRPARKAEPGTAGCAKTFMHTRVLHSKTLVQPGQQSSLLSQCDRVNQNSVCHLWFATVSTAQQFRW